MRWIPFAVLLAVAACSGHEPNPTIFAHECEQCHTTRSNRDAGPDDAGPNFYYFAEPTHVDFAFCLLPDYSCDPPPDPLPDPSQTERDDLAEELRSRTNKCVACHSSTVDWGPSDNDGHDSLFIISSGDHGGKDCEECHPEPTPDQWFTFNCLNEFCHKGGHTESAMRKEHSGKSGYAYESPLCLDCHPDWDEDWKK